MDSKNDTPNNGTPENGARPNQPTELAVTPDDMIAQKVETITVAKPDANKVLRVKVEAGRTLKLEFNNLDVVKREVIDDDLVLTFKNGGKVVLQDYMEAFGLMADIPTKVVQADGTNLLLPDLLDVAARPPSRQGRTDVGDTDNTPVSIDAPAAGESRTVNLRFGRSVKLNFKSSDVSRSTVDDDGNLVLTFQNGGTLTLVGWQSVASKASLKALFQDKSVALIELPNTAAGGDEAFGDGDNRFSPYDAGVIGPGIPNLGPLGNELLAFTTVDPNPTQFPPPGNPPGNPPGGPRVLPPIIGTPGGNVAPPVIGTNTEIREDIVAEPVRIQVNTQDTADELVSVKIVSISADITLGAITVTDGTPANNPIATTILVVEADPQPDAAGDQQIRVVFDLTAHPGLDQVLITIPMTSPEDSDVDDRMVIHATDRSQANPNLVATTYATYIQQIDAILDQAGDVQQTIVPTLTANSAAPVDLNLDFTLINAGFGGSLVGGPDTDGSERVTAVTITLSDASATVVAGAGFPASVEIQDLGGGVFELKALGNNPLQTLTIAEVEQAIEALSFQPSAGSSGTVTGTIQTTTAEILAGDSIYSPIPPNPPTPGQNSIPNPIGPNDQITFVPEVGKENPTNNTVVDTASFSVTVQAPVFALTGDTAVVEGTAGAPNYNIGITGMAPAQLAAGETFSVDVMITLPGGVGQAEAADFTETFLVDMQQAGALVAGVSVADLGGGMVRVTFNNTAPANFPFELPTLDDALVEGDETFNVKLLNPLVNNATGGAVSATQDDVTTTITDNDANNLLFSVTGDATVIEGTAGEADYTVTYSGVTLQAGQTVSIDLTPTYPGAPGGAEAADFLETFLLDLQQAAALTPGVSVTDQGGVVVRVTFDSTAPTSFGFELPTLDDLILEGDETYSVTGSNPLLNGAASGSVVPSVANTTITDNDLQNLVINLTGDTTVTEGGTPNYSLALTGVTIGTGKTVSVDLNVNFIGGNPASAADFVEAFLKDLQDAAGTQTGISVADQGGGIVRVTFDSTSNQNFTFGLPTFDDALVEGDETFQVEASNVLFMGAAAVPPATLANSTVDTTILENDSVSPLFSINDVIVDESAGTATFTIFRTGGDLSQPSSVDYATADNSALAPGDYTAVGTTTVNFAANQVAQTVTVGITDDLIAEPTETFFVNLTNPANGTIIDSQGVGTILDDDSAVLPRIYVSDAIASESAGTITFTLTRLGTPAQLNQTSTVNVATAGGSATDPEDYLAASTTPTLVSFAAGVTSQTVTVDIVNDLTPEALENFLLNLSGATNAVIADPTGVGYIFDDDAPPPATQVAINDVTVTEGTDPTATFTITRAGDISAGGTVIYTTADGSATQPGDYTLTAGAAVFAAGQATATVTVPITDDFVFENPEQFTVNLLGSTAGTIVDATGVGTILDNDTPFGDRTFIGINDVVVDEAAGTATFIVTRSGDLNGITTLDFATADGSAVQPLDYTSTPGSLTFAVGEGAKTITVPIIDDALIENTEQYLVNLTNVVGGQVADGQGVGTIIDNDGPNTPNARLFINDVVVNEDAGFAVFTVTRVGDTSGTATVDYTLSDGTAVAPNDYINAGGGTLTFTAGVTTQTISVPIVDDLTPEFLEQFQVNLANATNASIVDNTGEGFIIDNDQPGTPPGAPVWAIDDVSVTEGGTLVFTVTRSGDLTQAATIDFATQDQTAISPADFAANAGTLAFGVGVATQTVSVTTVDDALFEGAERLLVLLSNQSVGTIVDGEGIGTIVDNEAPPAAPVFSINDVIVDESAGTATFTVIRVGGNIAQPSSVDYTTADNSAVAPGDYTAVATTTINFAANQIAQTITVDITDDAVFEPTETFFVNLTNPVNGIIVDNQGVGTILDDDASVLPRVFIADAIANESDGTITFTLTRVGTPAQLNQASTVDVATAEGSATDPEDYLAASTNPTTVAFAAGVTTQTVTVALIDDAVAEPLENFTLNLSNPTNLVIGDPTGVGYIFDDDAPPAATLLSINDVTVNESDGTAIFTVTRSGDVSGASTVNYLTSDGTAMQPGDYSFTFGTLNFAATETSQTITVPITDDTVFETPEQFLVNLFAASNATIIDATGVGTILDDDTPFGDRTFVGINDVVVDEAAGTATFIVTRSGDLNGVTTLDFATADGSAGNPLDYTSSNGSLSFAVGEGFKTITVPIIDDLDIENTEQYLVNLTNVIGAQVADGQGVGTIIDNDGPTTPAARLFIDDVVVNESAGFAVFTVTRVGDTSGVATVDYSLSDGTAIAPLDYLNTGGGTLTFASGVQVQNIFVPIVDDLVPEFLEQFQVNLANATNATIIDNTGEGFIIDNDRPGTPPGAPVWAVDDVTVTEGGDLVFTVTRSGDLTQAATIDFTTADQSAVQPDDYTAQAGTLAFGVGVATQTVTVPTIDDATYEGAERMLVLLSNQSVGSIVDGEGIGTITDNDAAPVVTIGDAAATEGSPLLFTVSLSNPSAENIVLDLNALSGTATAVLDFENISFRFDSGGGLQAAGGPNGTQVTIPAGTTSITVEIDTVDDAIVEGLETMTLAVGNVVSGTVSDASDTGTGTINDNDQNLPPVFAINDVVVDESAGTATFIITRSGNLSTTSSVDYFTADGSALQPGDYTQVAATTVNFAAGVGAVAITIDITDDAIPEPTENFFVNLTNPVDGVIGDAQGQGIILDDDIAFLPRIYVSDAFVVEGDPGDVVTMQFTLSRVGTPGQLNQTSEVTVQTANNSAFAGVDYAALAPSVVQFAPGQDTQVVQVSIIPDLLIEPTEQFQLLLSNPTNALIGDPSATGYIIDDDGIQPQTQLAINDVVVNESDGTATFTVSRTGDTSGASSTFFVTADGSAVAATDYVFNFGQVNFAAGEATQTITIGIQDDAIFETPEEFTVNLFGAVGATIVDATGVGTILDDDTPPQADIQWQLSGDTTVNEGADAGYTLLTTGDPIPAGQTVTIDLSITYPGGNAGAEVADFDYSTSAPTFDFAQHVIAQLPLGILATRLDDNTVRLSYDSASPAALNFSLSTLDDILPEFAENYALSIQNQTLGTVAPGGSAAVTTILDNDQPPQGDWQITGDTAVVEGDSAGYTVSYGGPLITAGNTASIDIDLNDTGSADEATDFPAGALVNAVLAAAAVTTGVTATDQGGGVVRVTYDSTAAQHFSFSVPTFDDAAVEGLETYSVDLLNPSAGTTVAANKGSAPTTIIDNDNPGGAPVWTIAGSSVVVEGDSPAYTVQRLGDPIQVAATETLDIQIDLPGGLTGAEAADFIESFIQDLNDAAPAGISVSDLGNGTARLTFADNAPAQFSFPLPTLDDALVEQTEAFALSISNPSNGQVNNANSAVVTRILDNDQGPAPVFSINDVIVDESDGTATFTVFRSGDLSNASAIDFTTSDGSALQGLDYLTTNGTLVFNAGVAAQTITVDIVDDAVFEPTEFFTVDLSNAINGIIGDNQGVGTILDDDRVVAPRIFVSDAVANESDGTITFAISRVGTPDQLNQVSTATVQTAEGSATDPEDYIAAGTAPTNVIFAAGQTLQFVTVPIVDDMTPEGLESFLLNITGVTNAIVGDPTGTGYIIDNDLPPPPTLLSIDDVTVTEGTDPVATFTVTRSGDTTGPSTVIFVTSDGTAMAPGDYTANGGLISFAAGETTKTIDIAITDDAVFENPEQFTVNLFGATGATIVDPTGVGTILDNDNPFGDRTFVGVNDVVVDESAGVATFIVSRSGDLNGTSTIDFSTSNGSATGGLDYTPVNGTLTFGVGVGFLTVDVPITEDLLPEISESFFLNLTNPTGTQISDNQGVGTIIDNDTPGTPQARFFINDVVVNEDAGFAVFTVSRVGSTAGAASVDYSFTDGTATSQAAPPADYIAVAGTVNFGDGVSSQTIQVPIVDDNIAEFLEQYQVNLSNAVNGTIIDHTGEGFIIDNDQPGTPPGAPVWAIDDVSVSEGGDMVFTVTRSGDLSQAATIDFATGDLTATDPADFTGSSGTLAFGVGVATQTVTVPTIDDLLFEGAERMQVLLSNASTGTIVDGTGIGTIVDNDDPAAAPIITINDVIVNEDAGTATFTVLRVGDTSQASSVDFQTADGTALAGLDYGTINGTVNFGAGVAAQQITVSIIDDALFESPEQFFVNLSNASNAVIADDQGVGVILDDDTQVQPRLFVSDAVANESDGTITFTVTRVGDTSGVSSADVSTMAGSAFDGTDYVGASTNPATVTFNAGETTQLVTVDLIDDAIAEPLESFLLNLSNLQGAEAGDPTGTGYILDDDAPPADAQLAINDVTVTEGVDPFATFTVTRSGDTSGPASVFVVTSDGTAVAGADYTATVVPVSFAAGETTMTVSVPIIDDNVFETPEQFTANLFGAVGATIVDASGVGTILDDDNRDLNLQWMVMGDNRVLEGNDATYTVNFSGDTIQPGDTTSIDIALEFSPGPIPAEQADFTEFLLDAVNEALPGHPGVTAVAAGTNTVRLTFDATAANDFTINLTTFDDMLVEGEEVYAIVLRNPEDGIIKPGLGGVPTIIDDNDVVAPDVIIGDAMAVEGSPLLFDVSLTSPAQGDTILDLATSGITATDGVDYENMTFRYSTDGGTTFQNAGGPNGTQVTIPDGTTAIIVEIDTIDDPIFEGDETMTLAVGNVVSGAVGDASDTGEGLIKDDDAAPTVSVSDGVPDPAIEGTDPTITFTITLSNPASDPVEVTYQTVNGTATGGADFTPIVGGTVTFAPGQTSIDVPVTVLDDAILENLEDFTLMLTTATLDPGGSSTALTITDDEGLGRIQDNDRPVAGDDDDQMVHEENLPDGTNPNPPVGASDSVVINFGVLNNQVDISDITLSVRDGDDGAPIANLQSMGRDLTFIETDLPDGARSLTAEVSAGFPGAGTEVFSLTIARNGDYSFTLSQKLDHPDLNESGVDDPIDLDFNYTAEAGLVSDDGTITVTVKDDAPIAKNDKFFVDETGAQTTDLVIIFDHSGSMGDDPGVPGFSTRLQLAQDAVQQLLTQDGIQNVMIVGFDSSATAFNWGTPAEALVTINSFIADGTTNYADAIQELMDNFDTVSNPRPPAADVTNVYFLSDGVPVPDTADLSTNGLVGPWESFLQTNNVDQAYAVGIGSGVSGGDADLEEIAFPNGDPDNPVILLDEGDLASTLVSTVTSSISGNVLVDNGSGEDMFGADGEGQILSITVDGTTYTYNAQSDSISAGGPPQPGSTLTVMTALGGELTFEFADNGGASAGDFTYVAPSVDSDQEENITYAIRDFDGDVSQASFDICITDVEADVRPVARDDMDMVLAGGFSRGNVIDGDEPADEIASSRGSLVQDFEGNGPAIVRTVEHEGVVYTLNIAGDDVSVTGVPAGAFSYDDGTGRLTITTGLGGTLTIDLDGGDPGQYTYEAPAALPSTMYGFDVDNFGTSGPWSGRSSYTFNSGGQPGDEITVTAIDPNGLSSTGDDDVPDGTLTNFNSGVIRGIGVARTSSTNKVFSDEGLKIDFATGATEVDLTLADLGDLSRQVHWIVEGRDANGNAVQFQGNFVGSIAGFDGPQDFTIDQAELATTEVQPAGGYSGTVTIESIRLNSGRDSSTEANGFGRTDFHQSFVLNAVKATTGNPMESELFTYTIEDTDGDRDSAVLSMKVKTSELADKLVINEIGLDVGRPSGGSKTDFIEIRNLSGTEITEADLDTLTLEIVGANGSQVTVDLSGVDDGVPAGGFLTIFKTGQFEITDGNTIVDSGTWTNSPFGWNLGDDTGEALAVNLVENRMISLDAFLANGANTANLTGPNFNGRQFLAGQQAAVAALAGLLGVSVQDLLDNEQFNGRMADQEQVLDALGITLPASVRDQFDSTGEKVFARVYGPNDAPLQDTDSTADWTTSNAPTDGRFNVASGDFNAQDGSDDLNPNQNAGVNLASAGQNIADVDADGPDPDTGDGPDFIYGSDQADTLHGGEGDDFIFGGGGDDMLVGHGGADVLAGGEGADTLDGGEGDDILIGGADGDFFVIGANNGTDIIADFEQGSDKVAFDTTSSINDFGDLAGRISQEGGHTIIDTDGGNSVVLANFTDPLQASDFLFNVPPCAPLSPCGPCTPGAATLASASTLPDAQPKPDGDDDYFVFGASGPQHVALSDLGVFSGDGGDLVLRMADNQGDGSRVFQVFRAGGDGTIDLATLGDTTGDGQPEGPNELALSFEDVMDLSEVTGGLVIHGRDGDAVSADLRGHNVSTQDHGGFTRYVIDNGQAQLDIDNLVQQNITTDLS